MPVMPLKPLIACILPMIVINWILRSKIISIDTFAIMILLTLSTMLSFIHPVIWRIWRMKPIKKLFFYCFKGKFANSSLTINNSRVSTSGQICGSVGYGFIRQIISYDQLKWKIFDTRIYLERIIGHKSCNSVDRVLYKQRIVVNPWNPRNIIFLA